MTGPSPLCVLHIGTEQTGTATLREFLALNRDRLREAGWLYPTTFGEGHADIVAYAREDGLADTARQEIEAAFDAECGTAPASGLIVSSPDLHARLGTSEERRRLKALLDRHCGHYRVVVYLRRQDRLAVGRLTARFLAGETLPAPIFPALGDDPPPLFDYRALLEGYAEVFGAEAITVRIYEEAELEGGDVVRDFAAGIGLPDLPGLARPQRRNEPLTPPAQRFLALFNQLEAEDGAARIERGTLAALLRQDFAGPGRMPARAQAERFYRAFAEGNEWVRRHFRPDRATLFSEDFSDYPEAAVPMGTAEEIVRVAAALLARQEARIVEYRTGIQVCNGILLLKMGDAAGAARRFEEAIRLDPSNAEAHHGLSGCLRTLGRVAEAREAARRAVALAPRETDFGRWLDRLEAERAAAE